MICCICFLSADPNVYMLSPNNSTEMPPRDPIAPANGEDSFPTVQPVVTPKTRENWEGPLIRRIQWRFVFIFSFLHLVALYGAYCAFYCKANTLLWGKLVCCYLRVWYILQWQIKDFPWGGGHGGALFDENVCENERIGSRWAVGGWGAPAASPCIRHCPAQIKLN